MSFDAPPAEPGRRARWPWWLIAMVAGLVAVLLGGVLVAADQWYGPPGGGLVTVGGAGLLALGGVPFLIGLAYYVLAPGLRGGAAAWQDVGSHRLVLATTLLVILLSSVGAVAGLWATSASNLCSVPGFLAAAVPVQLTLLAVTYLRFVRPGILTTETLGLRRDRLAEQVSTGVALGFGVLIVTALVGAALRELGVRQTQLADLQCVRNFPLGGFLLILTAGALLAPIGEELFFRGYVFRTYLETRGPVVAYGLTSLLFAVLHQNLPGLPLFIILSAMFCWTYQRTRSVVPSIVGHALNNLYGFSILYFTDVPL